MERFGIYAKEERRENNRVRKTLWVWSLPWGEQPGWGRRFGHSRSLCRRDKGEHQSVLKSKMKCGVSAGWRERKWQEGCLSIPVCAAFLGATWGSASIMGTDWNSHLPSEAWSPGLPVSARGPPEACSSFFPPFIPRPIFVSPSQITAPCSACPHWVSRAPPLPCPEHEDHNKW